MARHKPKTPAQIAAARVATRIRIAQRTEVERIVKAKAEAEEGIDMAALALPANEDVQLTSLGKRTRGKRRSWIDRVLPTDLPLSDPMAADMKAGNEAVTRMVNLVAKRRGHGDRPEGTGGGGCAELVNDHQIQAAREIEAIMARLGKADRNLLQELLEPKRIVTEGQIDWRLTVALMTGERNAHAQAAVVRSMARNLIGALERFDQMDAGKLRKEFEERREWAQN